MSTAVCVVGDGPAGDGAPMQSPLTTKIKNVRVLAQKKAANESAATSEEDEEKSCNNDTTLTN
jgi:hypothetical protein